MYQIFLDPMVVGREGIEPPQSKTADLQSAELTTCSTYPRNPIDSGALSTEREYSEGRRDPSTRREGGADGGNRTHNRRFTKPLLYR
jgi:hypothetical protein